jgi:hypothetical protein
MVEWYIIFLDLKKAFDCVDHSVLLKKIHFYGIKGNTSSWFRSYLTNRIQLCKIDQTFSYRKTVKCGIPQGSILGHIPFLLYINYLPITAYISSCSANNIMFPDDTNISANGKKIVAK